MNKDDDSARDRSIKVGRDAAGSVIIPGNHDVVRIEGGGEATGGQQDRGIPTAFISSTSEDLKAYRAAARDAGIGAGFLPVLMEYFAASGERPPLEACLHPVPRPPP